MLHHQRGLYPVQSNQAADKHITSMQRTQTGDRCYMRGSVWQQAATTVRRREARCFKMEGPLYFIMTFQQLCTFEILYQAYLDARRGKRSKYATAQYEANALMLTERLCNILMTKKYKPSKFEMFYVHEPKRRLVQAPAFVDKVVQHALVDNILYEAITKSFVHDNCASQIGKGLHFGLYRLQRHMTDYWLKNKTSEGWVLKCDVHHFFASIDHDIMKEKLRKKVTDTEIYDLLCTYIDSTPGLPLGYQTSQLFALLYLDQFDHFVKEHLHIKHYGRYMDDFYLIHPDKDYLRYCLKEITRFLAGLKLELNGKTHIFPLKNGLDFLGFHTYITESGKIVRKLRHSSAKRMKAKLKKWDEKFKNGEIEKNKILSCWRAWDAHAAHGDTYALRQKVAIRVSQIIGEHVVCRPAIRLSQTQKALREYRSAQKKHKSEKARSEKTSP